MGVKQFRTFTWLIMSASWVLVSCGSNPSVRNVGSAPPTGAGQSKNENPTATASNPTPTITVPDPTTVRLSVSLENIARCGLVNNALKSFHLPMITAQSVDNDFYRTGVTDNAAIASVALPLGLDLSLATYHTELVLPSGLGTHQVAFGICDLLSTVGDPRRTGCYNMENLNHNLVMATSTVGYELAGYVVGLSADVAIRDGVSMILTCDTPSPGYVLN